MHQYVQHRRRLLATTSVLAMSLSFSADARTIRGALPWSPNEASPPERIVLGVWRYFTPEEAATVSSMAQRIIPADNLGPGGGDVGCALYLDRQLAGSYGDSSWLYMQGPFAEGTPQQGPQSQHPPAVLYRTGLAVISAHCRGKFGGRLYPALSPDEQDAILSALENGTSGIANFDDKAFFEMLLQNMMEGYFADPIYGGNREMAGWALVGFPGTRYDYRDVLAHPGEPYNGLPVGIGGRPAWMDATR